MKAALRTVVSPDLDDLLDWQPDEPDFAILVQLLVGPADGPGEESFDVVVCTAGWLATAARSGPFDARHHTVVDYFDWPTLRDYFEQQVEGCTGEDWHEVAEKLSRIGHWEFEDYQSAPGEL